MKYNKSHRSEIFKLSFSKRFHILRISSRRIKFLLLETLIVSFYANSTFPNRPPSKMIFPRKLLKIHLGHKNRSFQPFWKWRGEPRQEVIYLFPLLTVSRLKLKNIFQRQSRSTEGRMPWPKETKEEGERKRERDRGREWKKESNDPPPWRHGFRITTMLELKFKSSKFGGQILFGRDEIISHLALVSREIKRFSSARAVMKQRWFTNDFRFLEARR